MQTYEMIEDAGLVDRALQGFGPIAVPPEKVRERVARMGLPKKFMYASMGPEGQKVWDRSLLMVANDYVVDLHAALCHGKWALMLGRSGAGKTYAMGAMMNEILRVFDDAAPDMFYMSATYMIPQLMDYRHFSMRDEYFGLKKRILDADILFVDDLLHAREAPQTRDFLFEVFDRRDQKRLATVVTGNAVVTAEDWSAVDQAFNEPFRRRLQANAKGLIAVV